MPDENESDEEERQDSTVTPNTIAATAAVTDQGDQ